MTGTFCKVCKCRAIPTGHVAERQRAQRVDYNIFRGKNLYKCARERVKIYVVFVGNTDNSLSFSTASLSKKVSMEKKKKKYNAVLIFKNCARVIKVL
jgi:hypothetical protein